ncbi:DnaB-like helicase N-terminal domain-containing protein [Sulfurimonas sp.]|uniref:DnaB-like helicase N-terminal domain-containing protein n=1 Tax=Sulfurimonas sp. TaxID=2022749 RepID=UPI0025D4DBE5|nr:DnaB-like helicase N-terminal domain-containing protein [Sulfurimonas sp.]
MGEDKYYDLEYEKTLLSSIIFEDVEKIEKKEINPLLFLVKEDFYLPAHAVIFDIIVALSKKNLSIDELFISKELNRQKFVGGEEVLMTILSANPLANTTPYILEIRKNRMFRDLIGLRVEISKQLEIQTEPSEMISELREKLSLISEGDENTQKTISARKLLEKYEGSGGIKRVPSNIPFLDDELGGGFDESGLVIYTGPPECGKTHLTYSIAEGASKTTKAGIISLEFGENDYQVRLKELRKSGIDIDIDSLSLNFDSHSLPSLISTLYGMANSGCKLVAIDSLHKVLHPKLLNPTDVINDVANRIDEVCKKTRMSIHLIALASKEDYSSERMGVLNSSTASHLAKVFIRIHVNDKNLERTIIFHKNKQTRKLPKLKISYLDNGKIIKGSVIEVKEERKVISLKKEKVLL